MFVIANDTLYRERVSPFINGGGLLARIQGASGGGLLFKIGYPQPLVASAKITASSGNLANIDVTGLPLQNIAALEISGVRYTAGTDISSLVPGTFLWDEINNQIIIRTC